mmetsp:Transcript_32213/g.28543  ORF Transcript_32213/g.28543 Transcript_32213/m.28543 type:complete len:160 (+) Transcript_32213:2-481(+)
MGNLCSGEENVKSKEINLNKRNKSNSGKKDKNQKKKIKSKKQKKGAKIPTEDTQVIATTVETETWDDNELSTLLPSEPTLSDAFDDKANLKIMKQAREKALDFEDEINNCDWEIAKESDGIKISRANSGNDQLHLLKEMTVNCSVEEFLDVLLDLNNRK